MRPKIYEVRYNACSKIQQTCNELILLMDNIFFFAPIMKKGNYLYSVFDRRMSLLLFKHLFYSVLNEYISLVDNEEILLHLSSRPSEMLSDILQPNVSDLQDETDEIAYNIDIVSGEKKQLSEIKKVSF